MKKKNKKHDGKIDVVAYCAERCLEAYQLAADKALFRYISLVLGLNEEQTNNQDKPIP